MAYAGIAIGIFGVLLAFVAIGMRSKPAAASGVEASRKPEPYKPQKEEEE